MGAEKETPTAMVPNLEVATIKNGVIKILNSVTQLYRDPGFVFTEGKCGEKGKKKEEKKVLLVGWQVPLLGCKDLLWAGGNGRRAIRQGVSCASALAHARGNQAA